MKPDEAVWVGIKNEIGALKQITSVIASHKGNIAHIEQLGSGSTVYLYLEIEGAGDLKKLVGELDNLDVTVETHTIPSFNQVYGKRVIVIGGGAQVAEVATGAISEADRHNIRGEKISVDTIPLVGEKEIAEAVRAVARLSRARVLILAGSLMGGEIKKAVVEIQQQGIKVVSLNMAGSVPEVADLVVSDPLQAGVMAVMSIADTANFSLDKQKGRRY
ncbi:MAG: hypothetical protein B6U97_04755 [Candidatus Altiarchaeales archaeon ex4484_96]|nr:MAG: hypothetical protein B6U97_04755 [Candidatus Altiarchaeales archaeon ex4484_96]